MARQINDNRTELTTARGQRRSAPKQGKKAGTTAKHARKPQAPGRSSVTAGAKAPRQTKKALLIALLKRRGGSDIVALSKALGWQAHTVRAALTGLRKAGFGIERVAVPGGSPSRYRITTAPGAATAR